MTTEDPTALDGLVGTSVTHRFLERSWGTQHVVTAGDPDAPPVVLLHGWPQHWLAWRGALAALAADAHLVAVDLRGFGWSAGPGDGPGDGPAATPTVADLAADVIAVIDDLELGRPLLVGHDWGGWIGFRAALDHPARLSAYAALAIVPPWLDRRRMLRHLPDWSYVLAMAAAGDRIARSPRAVGWLLDHSTSAAVWDTADGAAVRRSYLARVARPESAAMTRHLYSTLLRAELPAAWGPRPARLAVPTTVLVGADETIARPSLYLGRTLPGELTVELVPQVRHWLAEEAPGAVAAHLAARLPRRP